MTYLQAALNVLRRSKEPLSTEEILDRIITERLLRPQGQTPLKTLSAELYTNAGNDTGLVRLSESAGLKARKGTVRWSISDTRGAVPPSI